ncbi:diguanylate cyclase domain-containing protein [Pseudomonas sp. HK3]
MNKPKDSLKPAQKECVRSPMRKKVLLIVSLFIMASITLMGLGYLQSETLNSVRAFVRGEGLWAKAQKDAAFYLERYAHKHDINDFERFKKALSINLGDKEGRLGLLESPPNKDRSRKGFLAGSNHPDDVDSMMNFFLRFQNFYYLKSAIEIWEKGDIKIHEFMLLGNDIHQCVLQNKSACLESKRLELDKLNKELNKIGTDFSLILSEGARWIKSTLLTITIIITSLLSLLIFIVTRRIIMALDNTEKELMISEKRFLSLYNSNVIGIMEWDINGVILAANDAYLKMIGYSHDSLKNGELSWKALTPKEFRSVDKKAEKELLKYGMCASFEKEIIHKNGQRIPIYMGATLLNGEADKGICFVIDQSLQKINEMQLKLSATVFDASSDGIIITDKYKHVVAVNQAYCKKMGVDEAQLLGFTPPILVSNLMHDSFFSEISSSLQEHDQWQGDAFDKTESGSIIPVNIRINTVKDKRYKISHYVINITDISEQKAAEEQLRQLAHYDYLTGLANRSLYDDRLTQALARAKRHTSHCALLFFDLDKFKPINDEYGHGVGDLILQAVASRLQNKIRDNDTVARLGGDEFVIIMENMTINDDAANLAEKIIGLLSTPFEIKHRTLQIGCSVGISVYPEDGEDILTLTRNADIAMYAAKSSGTNHYYFYNPELKL